MVWIKLLLIVASAGILAGAPTAASVASADVPFCSPDLAVAGLCPVPAAAGEFNNGGVDLSAGVGHDGGAHTGDGGGPGNGGADVGDQAGAENGPGGPADPGTIVRDDFTVNCAPGSPCDPNLVVRISDLVNIRPMAATWQMEPSGWMLVGLPANFIAQASAHTESGLLLGFAADVHFTPVGYRWDYGDGTARTTTSGGATWAAQGLPEFSETATSHTFAASGGYTIAVAVVYTAEYRFAGQGWRTIDGTLAVPQSPLAALAGDARTVLVAEDCIRNPRGPGC